MRLKAHPLVVIAVPIALIITGMTQVTSAQGVTNPTVATVEAEGMTIPYGASIVNDATASGGQAVQMTRRNTSLTGQVSLTASVSSISLSAKGTSDRNGWPSMSMSIDGTTVLPVTKASSSTWHTYT